MADEPNGATVEGAASLIAGVLGAVPKEPEQKEPVASAPEATPDTESSTEDAAPQETAPSGDEQEAEPPETAPIEPPVSWDADAKAKFQAMPRELQEYWSTRENARDAEVRRVQNEAAQARQAAEAAVRQGTTHVQQFAQQLSTLIPALQGQLTTEFSDIKTREDLSRLAVENPARWAAFQDRMNLLTEANQAQQAIQQQQAAEAIQRNNQAVVKAAGELQKLVPELADPKIGEANRKALQEYLVKEGYTPQEIARTTSARAFATAWKAMQHDKAQAALKANKVKIVPTVVKPGSPAQTGQREALAAAQAKLRKTGSLDDAAAALARIL